MANLHAQRIKGNRGGLGGEITNLMRSSGYAMLTDGDKAFDPSDDEA